MTILLVSLLLSTVSVNTQCDHSNTRGARGDGAGHHALCDKMVCATRPSNEDLSVAVFLILRVVELIVRVSPFNGTTSLGSSFFSGLDGFPMLLHVHLALVHYLPRFDLAAAQQRCHLAACCIVSQSIGQLIEME